MELFIMFILVILQCDYANNLGGQRTEIGKSVTMMAQTETQTYGYNVRDELLSVCSSIGLTSQTMKILICASL